MMSAASNATCPVCRTADVVCGKWTLLIVRDLAEGGARLCQLERSLAGGRTRPPPPGLRRGARGGGGSAPRPTYPEVPPRVEYALTEKGTALVPLIEDMRRYGTRWLGLDLEPEAEVAAPAVTAA